MVTVINIFILLIDFINDFVASDNYCAFQYSIIVRMKNFESSVFKNSLGWMTCSLFQSNLQ